jgi:predicted PurR-regulated permease PerM
MEADSKERTRGAGAADGQPRPAPEDAPPDAAGWVRVAALAALTAALLALCAALAVPLLPALTWGAALAVVAWPLHAWVARRVARPNVAALLSTAAVVALVVAPVLFVAFQAARESAALAERFKEGGAGAGPRERLAQTPALGRAARWAESLGVDLDAQARQAADAAAQSAAALAGVSARAAAQCLVAAVVLFFLLRDRQLFGRGLRGLLPVPDEEARHVARRAADSIHANLYANVLTSAIDAAGAGLVFWAVGVPAPVLWAAVAFVVTLLPLVGSAGFWVPAVAALALAGEWGAAAAVLAWGVSTWVLVDHLLYVRLLGGRLRVHPLPLLVAILGGLAVFGASGLVLGPAVLAVTDAVLDVWRRRQAQRAG